MPAVKLNLIAAACDNMGIGINGTLPWRLNILTKTYVKRTNSAYARRPTGLRRWYSVSPRGKEMNYFTSMTSNVVDKSKKNAVIMGRRTWDCIPLKYRPLENRINIVLTRNVDETKLKVPEGVIVLSSLDAVIDYVDSRPDIESSWVIGGSSIYKASMDHPACDKVYLTEIQKTYNCDTFFPEIDPKRFSLITLDNVPTEKQIEGDISYYFRIYQKI